MSPTHRPTQSQDDYQLWPSEAAVAEALGRLMAFWGFKRNMGRVWAVLYLSDQPLTARQLEQGLGVSAGTVSMTAAELQRWGVVRPIWQPGERSRRYEAETDLWTMITRVLRERERAEIDHAQREFEQALEQVRERTRSKDPEERRRAKVQQRRIKPLLQLARFGQTLLDALTTTGRVDLSPLARFLKRR